KGNCGVINFLSSGITATVEHADVVILSGSKGDITIKSDVDELNLIAANGSRVDAKNIATLGLLASKTDITANKIDRIVLHGADNKVQWKEGTPQIDRQK